MLLFWLPLLGDEGKRATGSSESLIGAMSASVTTAARAVAQDEVEVRAAEGEDATEGGEEADGGGGDAAASARGANIE